MSVQIEIISLDVRDLVVVAAVQVAQAVVLVLVVAVVLIQVQVKMKVIHLCLNILPKITFLSNRQILKARGILMIEWENWMLLIVK